MPRKRTYDEMEVSEPDVKKPEPGLLQRIRNMWEFASVMQYIFVFGKAVKIDEDFDIEDFENECLTPGFSEKLEEIGLTLLKWISSHRGLNYDIWDEYTRRQYLAKAPTLNPYGDDEEPKRFRDFDIFTKIRILHQLTVWTFWNPDRMRERMPEHQRETDQLEWRIEEFGYDRDDRQYYLLDDNRLYRRTDPPLPAAPKAKPKANSKKAVAARRRESKRRKLRGDTSDEDDPYQEENEQGETVDEKKLESWEVDTLGGFKWECLAITLPDYHELCESLKKSKDPNEKALRERLMEEVLPIIEAAAERQRRKIERRERELLLMERMVGAKRSSRLADKQDRDRREAEQAETERKKQADLVAAHREQERQDKMELERQYRMMTREQRIKDREYKRLLKEEEVARDALEQKRIDEGEVRGSGRHLKERMERNKKELEDLTAEEQWTFDCSGCGVHGKNLDDGSHSVACERCNVWQHSKCLGISKSAAEKDDFHFVCKDCLRKEEDAKRPKISLKFRVGTSSPLPSSPAPPSPQASHKPKAIAAELPDRNPVRPTSQGSITNGYSFPHSSPLGPQPSSPYGPQSIQNVVPQHQYSQLPPGPPQHAYPTAPQYRPSSSGAQQLANSSPQRYGSSPYSSGYPHQPQPAFPSNMNYAPGEVQYPPYYNGNQYQYQYQNYGATNQRPLAASQNIQSTPRQPPQHPTNGQFMGGGGRLPSPVINHPTMSPTQGNMDVGPVAGIAQRSPPTANGTVMSANGYSRTATNAMPSQAQSTPRPAGQTRPVQTPTAQPLSGLSPKKQQSPLPLPLPQPTMVSPKPNGVPPSLATTHQNPLVRSTPAEKRVVSGTAILPPVENLRPSPEQLRNMSSNEPVPTPSKQHQPLPQHVAGPEKAIRPEEAGNVKDAGVVGGNGAVQQ